MEGIKEIATAYYERASEHEKNEIKEFFKTLDGNGDGKVTFHELETLSLERTTIENVFKMFDENGDGSLDFYEVLTLYYMSNKLEIRSCNGCEGSLVGSYFSCLLCLGKGRDTFDLCCYCHCSGKIAHEHSSEYLLDHHSLLCVMRKRTTEAESSRGKREMEELREIARAHFGASSPEVQALAREFFKSMDTDGDGSVDVSEFLEFMRHEGYSYMQNPHFFKELDQDSNGSLDFWEVMTLYYIIKSGRPFCNYCGYFIPGTFFSCVECFKNPKTSFDLCRDCYRSTKCKHNHGGRVQFLDNYTLLEARRDPILTQTAHLSLNSNQHRSNDTYTSSNPNRSNAIVPANKMDKWEVTFRALDTAVNLGINLASTLCTIL